MSRGVVGGCRFGCKAASAETRASVPALCSAPNTRVGRSFQLLLAGTEPIRVPHDEWHHHQACPPRKAECEADAKQREEQRHERYSDDDEIGLRVPPGLEFGQFVELQPVALGEGPEVQQRQAEEDRHRAEEVNDVKPPAVGMHQDCRGRTVDQAEGARKQAGEELQRIYVEEHDEQEDAVEDDDPRHIVMWDAGPAVQRAPLR